LVESAEDIISAISTCECKVGGLIGSPCLASADGDSKIKLSETERTILDFLDLDPTPIDIICESLKIGPGRLSAILLELELTGLIRQSPGKLFSRVRP
ncbi:MAG: DNA-processing protein DprA, partial [Desulfomonilaceae bacterium]